MTRIARLSFEDSFPLRGYWVRERHICRNQGCRRKLRLKWLSCVFVFFGPLLGQLLGYSRIVSIQILPAEAEANKREQHECVCSHCGRPLPRASFDAFIQKGERKNGQHKKSGDYKHADNRGRSVPVFQPLKDGQVIPFWPRYILRIRWVSRRSKL